MPYNSTSCCKPMFNKLKEKLKETLSIFSKKAEEEVRKEVIEELKKEEPVKKEKITGVKITYFVHGTTTDNENGLSTGWNQGELSELGKEQSVKLRSLLSDKEFDVVFCSDLKRAVDTTNITFANQQDKITTDKRLRECNYGNLNGKDEKIVKTDILKRVDDPFPNGESYRDVEKRMAEFLNELLDKFSGKSIAIVAHQAPQLALDVLLKGKTWEQAIQEDWRHTKSWKPGWDYSLENKVKLTERSPLKTEKAAKTEVIKREKKPVHPVVEPTEKKGIFTKIKETFTTRTISAEKFDDLFWPLELTLLEHNVAVGVTELIKKDLQHELVEKPLPLNVSKKVEETLQQTLTTVLSGESLSLVTTIQTKKKTSSDPYVIAFFGINGSGKTTTIAKVAHLLQQKKLSCVLAAGDTFRAAAIQQLEEHADKLGIRVIKHAYGADAAAVAYDAISYAKKQEIAVVLIDTAGRLHSNTNLMDELQKICRVAKPDLKIFIGESITGNDCIEQAQRFQEHIGIDGIILTKADVDEKGGTPLSISYVTKKPVVYLGVGQRYQDLEEFQKEKILEKLGI